MKKLILLGLLFSGLSALNREPIIVLDPAGHAKDPGRLLVENYERAETLKFTQALQQSLKSKYKVKPVIARSPGEEVLPLQIPSFSNRLGADFFIRIHLYREASEKPKIFLYHLLFNPLIDLARRDFEPLRLMPLHQAHFGAAQTSRVWGSKIYSYLNQEESRRYFDCYPLIGLPLKHMVGVTAPSLAIELGICRENRWKNLVEPLSESLAFLADEFTS